MSKNKIKKKNSIEMKISKHIHHIITNPYDNSINSHIEEIKELEERTDKKIKIILHELLHNNIPIDIYKLVHKECDTKKCIKKYSKKIANTLYEHLLQKYDYNAANIKCVLNKRKNVTNEIYESLDNYLFFMINIIHKNIIKLIDEKISLDTIRED
jgi:hypothetical protein